MRTYASCCNSKAWSFPLPTAFCKDWRLDLFVTGLEQILDSIRREIFDWIVVPFGLTSKSTTSLIFVETCTGKLVLVFPVGFTSHIEINNIICQISGFLQLYEDTHSLLRVFSSEPLLHSNTNSNWNVIANTHYAFETRLAMDSQKLMLMLAWCQFFLNATTLTFQKDSYLSSLSRTLPWALWCDHHWATMVQ